jgi:hypothetical protein
VAEGQHDREERMVVASGKTGTDSTAIPVVRQQTMHTSKPCKIRVVVESWK